MTTLVRRRAGPPGSPWLTLPRFIAASGVGCALLLAEPAITDPDFWWHLRNGQLLLTLGRLIPTSPYTFTVLTHHWVMQEWLTEVWFAVLTGASGRLGVLVYGDLLMLVLVGAILLRARLMGAGHGLTLGLGALMVGLGAAPIWGPRPQMESYALLAVSLYCVERQLRRGGWSAAWLPPLFLLWTNLEAGFIAGEAVLLVILGVEGWRWWRRWPGATSLRNLRVLAAAAAASVAATLVDPNGAALLLYPFQTQFDTAQQRLIAEWHSPDFHMAVLWPFLFLILSLAVLLARYRRCNGRDALLLLLVTPLAFQSVRQTAVLVVVAVPVWMVGVEILRRAIAARWPRRWPQGPQPRLIRAVEGLMLAMIVALAATQLAAGALPRVRSAVYIARWPVCAALWLRAGPGNLRIFNQYGDGGFLADHLPQDRVFIFGDAALMGNGLLTQYGRTIDLAPGWLRSLDRSRSQLVVYERGTPFALALTHVPQWVTVYQDRRVIVWERRALLGRLRLPPVPGTTGWARLGAPACAGAHP